VGSAVAQAIAERSGPVLASAEGLVAALAAQADRDASEPVDVTVDGYSGKMITVHVPDDVAFNPDDDHNRFPDCDDGTFAAYAYETWAGGDEPAHWHQGPGQIDEFWIVDVEGSIVDIRVSYRPDTPTELIDEMHALIESSTFEFP
jgi:hypothetical protein